MKREIIIVILITICIFLLNAVTSNYTNKNVKKMIESIDELKGVAEDSLEGNKKLEEIKEKINKIKSDWEEPNFIMSYYIEHDEIEKVNSSMVKFETSFNYKDYEEGLIELENCKYILNHIQDKNSIKIINFF